MEFCIFVATVELLGFLLVIQIYDSFGSLTQNEFFL